ncbi:MAG: hypothetical protein HZB47_01665 [Nitrosomonadales bacterium]|nr:hypothetical protein [Nitrosomonadales bacterium]
MLLAFALMAASAWHESVNAGELGRLFFTPQQRQQLEFQETRSSNSEDGSERRNYIMVNGVVQKKGGNRTIWVNGTAQAAGQSNDKAPATVPVTIPGKSQPVQLKVGQRLMLDTPAPGAEERKPANSAPSEDD